MSETLNVPYSVGDAVRVRGGRWRIADIRPFATCAAVHLEGADPETNGRSRILLTPFDRLERLERRTVPQVVSRPRGIRALARIVAASHPYDGLKAAAASRIDLHPFQLEPALAICRGRTSRILLADEVGLGKTIQAGLILAELHVRRRADRTLIVVPAGMRDQWAHELSAHFNLTSRIVDVSGLAAASSALPPGLNPWSVPGIAIVSVDFIKRAEVQPALLDVIWDVLILDEAHHLAPRTDRAGAAQMLAARSRVVVLLTATPHGGDTQAFDALCALGSHSAADSPIVLFRRSRTGVGFTVDRRLKLLTVAPTPNERRMHAVLHEYVEALWRSSTSNEMRRASELRLLISVLRKRAFSSAQSLYASVVRRRSLLTGEAIAPDVQPCLPFERGGELDDEEPRILGARGFDDVADECRMLETLAAAAQQAAGGESKLRALRRLLRRARERAIVFTEYRDTLTHVADALDPESIVVVHGGMTPRARHAAVLRFRSGRARVLLATDAAGEGLNLQDDCRLVISLELPWSPLRLEQRIGRVDRIGQTRPVHALAFLAGGTAESRIQARLIAKAASAQQTLAADAAEAAFHVLDLGEAAAIERVRLEHARRLICPTASSASERSLIIQASGRRTSGCIAVYRVCFHDAAQGLLEHLLVAVRIGQPITTRRRGNRELFAGATAFLERYAADLDAAVSEVTRRRLVVLQAVHDESLDARARRETGLRHAIVRESARTRLASAQQSLFHRRADEAASDDRKEDLAALSDTLRMRRDRLHAARAVRAEPPELVALLPT